VALLAHADHRRLEAGGVARSHSKSVPEGRFDDDMLTREVGRGISHCPITVQ